MQKKIYYFSGTHWDREWYHPFQEFRFKLVSMMDDLLDLLENDPSFTCFYLDGQVSPLKDYLEIRPEQEQRLTALIQKGRIAIGPWYTMPDEFLVSGEAIIRNLNLGMRICGEYEVKPWLNGYVCDMFGHIAQLPQIFSGFGIRNVVLGRGTIEKKTNGFFRWVSPDGSDVTVCKLPDNGGYGGFAMEVCGQMPKFVSLEPNSQEFRRKAKDYIDHLLALTEGAPCAIIFDAMDHEPAHSKAPAYLSAMQEMYPDVEFVFGHIDDAYKSLHGCKLQERRGELIDTADVKNLYGKLITNTLSSRYPLKRRNDLCENLLEKWLEPLHILSKRLQVPFEKNFVKTAWKYLLQNHAHDSICGCAIDRVHEEMMYRFSQTESIVQACTHSVIEHLTHGNQMIDAEHDCIYIVNVLPQIYSDVIYLQLPFAREYPTWAEPMGDQEIKSFRIFDEAGIEIEYVITDIKTNCVQRFSSETIRDCDLYTVKLPVTLNPFGLTRYRVVAQTSAVRYFGGLAQADGSLENEFLRVTVEADGCICIEDKELDATYPHLLGIVDDGDIGDGWWSIRPAAQSIFVGTRLESVEISYNGNLSAALKTVRTVSVPEDTVKTANGYFRSEHVKHIRIESTVTLNRNDRAVQVEMKVDNVCQGHRMRLRIPTYTDSKQYTSSQTFCFVERNCGIDPATASYFESEQLEKNTEGIVYRQGSDGKGIAVLADYGMKECGCPDNRTADILMTMFRSVGKTYTTNGEMGGQLLAPMTFSFVLLPLSPSVENATLKRLQANRRQPIRSFIGTENLTSIDGGMKFESDSCVIESLKECEDSEDTILRVCNYTGSPSECRLYFKTPCRAAYACDLSEREEVLLAKNASCVKFTVEPYRLFTIKICDNKIKA